MQLDEALKRAVSALRGRAHGELTAEDASNATAAELVWQLKQALKELAELSAKTSPGPWKIREHPLALEDEPDFYISASMTDDHPYDGHCEDVELLSDEDYPRKRLDADFIVKARQLIDSI